MTTMQKIWNILTEEGSQYNNLSPSELTKMSDDIYYVIRRLQLDYMLKNEKNSGNVKSLTLFRLCKKHYKIPELIRNPF